MRDYQIADLAYYIARPKCFNLSDPGTGKTPSVCVYQQYLWEHCQVASVWVQPKGLMAKNKRELLRFTDLKPEDIVIVDGTPEQVEAALKSDAKIFLMGFRRWTLSWKSLPKRVRAVIVDESHRGFKNADSSACQALFEAFRTKRMEYFLAMTGTLISGDLTSAYPMIHVVEPRYYMSVKHFLNYHTVKNFEGKVIGWRNHEKISRILGTHGIRRTFKDVFGEQEIVHQCEAAELSPKQEEYYRQFEEEAILELEKFFLDGTQPGVGFIRARQLLEHPNRFPDITNPGEFLDLIPNELSGKEMLLEQHLLDHQTTGMPLIIFSPLVPQQIRISELCKRLKLSHRMMNGSIKMSERDTIDKDFQAGKFQVLIASPAVCDVGYNWQYLGGKELDHIIFMAPDYLDSTINQAIGRGVRGKRETPLRVTYLYYPDTIDMRVFQIVHRKSVDAHLVDSNRPVLDFGGLLS